MAGLLNSEFNYLGTFAFTKGQKTLRSLDVSSEALYNNIIDFTGIINFPAMCY